MLSSRVIRSIAPFNGFLPLSRLISTSNVVNNPLKVGDKLPPVDVYEGDPGNKVKLSSLKGKVVIFGVPGAFTPTCSKEHAPTFITKSEALKGKGVAKVVCLAVNDPFVMKAWGDSLSAKGKVQFLADTTGEFTKKADLAVDLSPVLGNVRSKRFVLVAEDGVVKAINVEPDGTGLSCSRADDILKLL